jgi:hypothetical protein
MGKYIEHYICEVIIPHPYIMNVILSKANIKKYVVIEDQATFYSCTLKLYLDNKKCKFKGGIFGTEQEAVDDALAVFRDYANKEGLK